MKPEEIREWENGEIEARLVELKEELFRLRFRSATMALENPQLVPSIRKDIARLNTILRERELAAQRS
jgi:large subunit ribosomal protein L29